MDSNSRRAAGPRTPATALAAHSRARASLDAICERLRAGTPINHACVLEGVPRRTFYDLLARDPEAELAVQAARAEAAERLRENIIALAQGGEGNRGANPNVLLHLAERLYPDDYSPPKQRIESTTVVLTPEERRQKYAELRRGGVIVANADAELEAECVAAGLLPADVVDGEIEEGE